jgi:hypothetical protein
MYDTALRIGAKLKLFPTKVYLHAGTRLGARALGLDDSAATLKVLCCQKNSASWSRMSSRMTCVYSKMN